MRRPAWFRSVLTVAVLAALALPRSAAASDAAFVISLDREAVAPGEPFVCEVNLSVAGNGEVDGFRPPEFKGLRVLSTPQFPTRSTQMQIGGGQTMVQNDFSWRFEVMVPPGARGPFVIGAARVRFAGRELKSNALSVRVGSGPPAGNPRRGGGAPGFPFDLFGGGAAPEAPASSAGTTFIRVVADKARAYLGEPVVVTWSLCTTQRLDKFDTVTEARTDGFWSEDIPSTNPRGRLAYTTETIAGRAFQVATLYQKALFPLREGKLTVTPVEAEVAQVDFFGTALRTQRLKADPVTIEALPLPREGQPAGFDAGNVGKYELEARADRTTVSVGEAVTVTVEIKGVGNVRNVHLPPLAVPAGWKSYPPKETVTVDAAGGVGGTKVAEVLLLPERAGAVMLPSLEVPTFDPETKRYVTLKSDPMRLDATGEAPRPGAAPLAPGTAGPAVENVIAAAIRPIRARTRLGRDVGTTFLRSRAFGWMLFLPPFGLGLAVLVERVRERLATDTRRTRRRRMRTMVRKRLGSAVAHRDAGRVADFYIEIDRVLREVLAARLGRVVTGLRRDELEALLSERGLRAEITARFLGELEACDLARFAPGGKTESAAAMSAALERADELIGLVEKAALREEAPERWG
ncbi:MAG TPA: BatD family protein [Polyangia bacterium]|nr:BatD family protein [Polyangia bacterium]